MMLALNALPKYLAFKTEAGQTHMARLIFEFRTSLDYRVQAAVWHLSDKLHEWFSVMPVVTCVLRTVEENATSNGKVQSAHLTARAIDLRLPSLEPAQVQQVVAYIQQQWGSLLCVVYHDSGSGPHLHININKGFCSDEQLRVPV